MQRFLLPKLFTCFVKDMTEELSCMGIALTFPPFSEKTEFSDFLFALLVSKRKSALKGNNLPS